VAIKKLKPERYSAIAKDFPTLQAFSHPNIVPLLCLYQDQYVVSEFIEDGSLQIVLTNRKSEFKSSHFLNIIIQICDGMSYLASQNIIHYDLARSILIQKIGENQWRAKIYDYGFGLPTLTDINDDFFPIKWSSPEVLESGSFSTKADVYMFGVLIWEIYAFGASPYYWMNNKEAKEAIIKGERLPITDNCPSEIYLLISTLCWGAKPDDRSDFVKLLSDLQRIYKNLFENKKRISNSKAAKENHIEMNEMNF